jgi:hypothetical protein
MAAGDPVPPDRIIFRSIRGKQLNPDKTINEIAFLLKPAHDEFPDETYLSFGVDAHGAVAGLANIRYVGTIQVADILALGLTVVEDADPQKVQVAGMPLARDDEPTALRIAKDLRNKTQLRQVLGRTERDTLG